MDNYLNMDTYLDRVSAQIRSRRARDMAVAEIRAHIEDQAEAYCAEGMEEAEAVKEAVRQMGDPVKAGVELDRIHRPKMEWRLFLWIMAFSILGLGLQYLCFYRFGEAVGGSMNYFVRQCMYTAAGLLAMTAVCLCDYSILGTHPQVFGGCFLGGLALVCMSGIPPIYNGAYGYLKCLMYFFIPVYAGILYGNRGKGLTGVTAGAAWTGAAFLTGTAAIGGGLSVTGDVTVVCGAMLCAAVWKEWFGVSRKKGLTAVSLLFAAAVILLTVNLKPYQMARFQAFFRPEDFEQTIGYHLSQIRKIVSGLTLTGAGGSVLNQADLLRRFVGAEVGSEYMILQSAVVLGLAGTLVLCAAYALFFWYLLSMAVREKNSLGMITALGCTLILVLETVRNVMYNFGLGLVSTAGIPFFSYGKVHTLAVYGILGVLLSIYSHRAVAWEKPVSANGKASEEGKIKALRIGKYVIHVEKTEG